jgi:hypothetical protein
MTSRRPNNVPSANLRRRLNHGGIKPARVRGVKRLMPLAQAGDERLALHAAHLEFADEPALKLLKCFRRVLIDHRQCEPAANFGCRGRVNLIRRIHAAQAVGKRRAKSERLGDLAEHRRRALLPERRELAFAPVAHCKHGAFGPMGDTPLSAMFAGAGDAHSTDEGFAAPRPGTPPVQLGSGPEGTDAIPAVAAFGRFGAKTFQLYAELDFVAGSAGAGNQAGVVAPWVDAEVAAFGDEEFELLVAVSGKLDAVENVQIGLGRGATCVFHLPPVGHPWPETVRDVRRHVKYELGNVSRGK